MSKMLSHTCRACLFPLNAATNVPIFKEYNSDNLLSYMIADTIQILPEPDDNLGENVCKFCAEKIFNFYEFRLMYIESEKKLREHLLQYEKNQQMPVINGKEDDDDDDDDSPMVKIEKEATTESEDWKQNDCLMQLFDDWIDPTMDANGNDADHSLRWACTNCSKRFDRRALLRKHRKIHSLERKLDQLKKQTKVKKQTSTEVVAVAKVSVGVEKPKRSKNPMPKLEMNENYRWRCKKCFANLRTRRLLRDHNMQHKNASFVSTDMNQTHNRAMDIFTPEVTIEIDEDEIVSTDDGSIIADETSSLDQQIQQQQQQPKKETRWKCSKCRKSFETRRLMRAHKATHTFEIKLNLKSKATMLSTTSTAKTKKTSKGYKSLSNTQRKKRSFNKNWNCNSCSETFDRRSMLRAHRRAVHQTGRPQSQNSPDKSIDNYVWQF